MAYRFGLVVPQGWRMDLVEIDDPVEQYAAMTSVAQAADEGGFDSIWVVDHFHTVPTPEIEAVFEAWTVTSTFARDTKRVRIGQMVSCNSYRNPALLAKIASTVDVASNGRLNFGIGAGWYEHEWRAYGYGFPEARERLAMLRESLEVIHAMWTDNHAVYHGKRYAIDGAINEPKGVQKPHPPLWIGGGGEQVTLKLVARWGDACNVGAGNPETVRHKLEVLRGHCKDLDRDYDEIVKSSSLYCYLIEREETADEETATVRGERSLEEFRQTTFVATIDQIEERIHQLIDAGADYFILQMPGVAYNQDPVRRIARELIPRFA
ncbi:MAG: LLM class F420-dependent oxidoreductase [Thermomicrobiales bacterium]